jgi:hypothetical protein
MWLINVRTFRLEEVPNFESKRYAILSHTWGDDEVSFKDIADSEVAQARQGYEKVKETCRLADELGLGYAWIDTCCIDKSSSAELSEAINSMWKWYHQAAVCFVHLYDMPPYNERIDGEISDPEVVDSTPFPKCRWFTRGWTLQELIAPKAVEFYDSEWRPRGTKGTLKQSLSLITGVPVDVLERSGRLFSKPVATRMSWAAKRETTKPEDTAYCLLGIFGVNMAMIYGEGSRAFIRLQEEIAKESNDRSLFAWKADASVNGKPVDVNQKYRGLFAQSPSEFYWCFNDHTLKVSKVKNTEFMITNDGLRFETFLARDRDAKEEYVFNLSCETLDEATGRPSHWGVYLEKTPTGFVRFRPKEMAKAPDALRWGGRKSPTYIRKTLGREELASRVFPGTERSLGFSFENAGVRLLKIRPLSSWDDHAELFMTDNNKDFTGVLVFRAFQLGASYGRHELQVECMIVCGLKAETTPSGETRLEDWAALYAMGETITKGSVFELMAKLRDQGDEIILHELRKYVFSHGHQQGLIGRNGEPMRVKNDLGFQRLFEISLSPRERSTPMQRDTDRHVSVFEFNVSRKQSAPKQSALQRLFKKKQSTQVITAIPERVWWDAGKLG